MSCSPEALLYAAYAAHSQGFVDLGGLPGRIGETLWIGSYFGLIGELPRPPAALLDIDASAAGEAARRFPGIPVVQADVCHLPFRQRFDSIIMAGAVSAYLLDDAQLTSAAASLATALRPHAARCLYLDAYHSAHILDSPHFNGREGLQLDGRPWWREARSQRCPGEAMLLDVTLALWPEDGSRPAQHYHFRQRAFTPNELCVAFQRHGLACQDLRVDEQAGRCALVLGA